MVPAAWAKEYTVYSYQRRLAKCLIVLILGGWSIYQTWTERIYFTMQTGIYVNCVMWSLVRPHEYVWNFLGEVASTSLITIQLCMLSGLPKEIAYSNFSTIFIYFISGYYKNREEVMDLLTALQLAEMFICAYLLNSIATMCLACLYFYLRYLCYLNLIEYDIAVAMSIFTMGMISDNTIKPAT